MVIEKLTLLTLPCEIRYEIWKHLFALDWALQPELAPDACYLARTSISRNPVKACSTSVLAALLVCRQIYHEARSLFYTENILSFSNPEALFSFMRWIKAYQREQIRRIHVSGLGLHWSRINASKALSLLQLCPNLREVHVDFDKALLLMSCMADAQDLFRLGKFQGAFEIDTFVALECCTAVMNRDPSIPVTDGDLIIYDSDSELMRDVRKALSSLYNLRGMKRVAIRADMVPNHRHLTDHETHLQGQVLNAFESPADDPDWPLIEIEFDSLRETVAEPRPNVKSRYHRALEDRVRKQRLYKTNDRKSSENLDTQGPCELESTSKHTEDEFTTTGCVSRSDSPQPITSRNRLDFEMETDDEEF